MAKLTAVKGIKKGNESIIAGYKVALRKLDTERCGFHEGDELEIIYKKEEIRIKKKQE